MAGSTRIKTNNVASGTALAAARVHRPAPVDRGQQPLEPATATLGIREVMDIRQAAEYLGISPDSLYKYASDNFIPAFKLGNRWRFKRSLLESWMERQSSLQLVPSRDKAPKSKQKKPSGRVR